MSDSTAIDTALIALLAADATLLSYCPNGVFYAEAPGGSTRFVIVSLIDESDAPMFGARAYEDALYLVEARMLSTAGGNIAAAAARIDVLLENASLTIDNYRLMTLHREERVRMTEVDALDASLRWLRRGGQYRLVASATVDPDSASGWIQPGWLQTP
jgi:hypothetical protein